MEVPAFGVDIQAVASLPSSLASAGRARSFVRCTLEAAAAEPPPDEAVEVVELLTSEVVTNAVQHTGASPVLEVMRRGDRVRVSVVDPSPRLPVCRDVPDTEVSGRGMALVDTFSSAWGVEHVDPTGKRVWFEVEVAGPTLDGDGESAGWSRSGDDLAEEGRGSTGQGAG